MKSFMIYWSFGKKKYVFFSTKEEGYIKDILTSKSKNLLYLSN